MPEAEAPVPAVLLLHGFTAHKEEMVELIGSPLLDRGVASLAVDLPVHGARSSGIARLSLQNPMALVSAWRLALREANTGLDFLARQPGVDASRIGLVGYSLGAYLSVFTAATNAMVRVVALIAGGDLPDRTPFAPIVRTIADPLRAVGSLAGRPLLMMNGTRDRLIRPEQASVLFDAAPEPKELRWYDGPHWPTERAMSDVADWVATRLAERPSVPLALDAPAPSSRPTRPHKESRARWRTRSDRSY